MMPRDRFRQVLVVAAVAILSSCSGGGGTTSVTPSLALSLSPTSGSVAQGASISVTATATGAGGFTGTATFTVTNLPSGVTFSVSNTQTSGSVTTATVQLTVGSATAPGSYNLTFSASGTGVSTVSKTFALTVTSSSVAGYTLSALPTTLSIAQGSNANTTITISRTGGFAGSVSLAASGMGSGLTAGFNPSATTGNTSTLTLTASASATTGTVTVTITGTAAGLANQTTTVQVTVTAAGGSGNVTLDFTNCGSFIKPIWLAFQDGNGAWTRVTPTGDVYHFTISSAKGGYAAVTQTGAITTTAVRYFLQSEIAGTTAFCPAGVGTNTVTGTVAGIGAGQIANLAIGGGTNFALANGPFSVAGALNGVRDFFGYRTATVGGPTAADRAFIIRDVNVGAATSVGTVDFGGGSAITPVAGTVNVAGSAAGDAIVSTMTYLAGAGCSFGAMYSTPSSASTALNLFGIPAASQRATDYHALSLFVKTGATITRTLVLSFHTFAPQTVTIGAQITAPAVTALAQAGYKRLQAVGTIPAGYTTAAQLSYTQQGTAISAVVFATDGWIGGSTATLAFPDLSAVAGWTNSWAPAAGSTVDWTFLVNDVNYTTQCTEGARLLAAQVTGVN